MGNAELLPLHEANQDIGYVAVILRQPNKVQILYGYGTGVHAALCRIVE